MWIEGLADIRTAAARRSPSMMRPKVLLRPGGAGGVCTTPCMTKFLDQSRKMAIKISGKKRTRQSSPVRRLDHRDVQQAFQYLRLLRAGDGVAAADQEAGHAVDAQPMRPQVLGVYHLAIGVT
jgi:hypothetical protein